MTPTQCRRYYLALCCIFCLAGSASAMRFEHANDTLLMQGEIRQHDDTQLASHLTPDISQVIVTSQGGNAAAAIRMGLLLQARQIKVIVSEYCFSACASFLFLPAADKEVMPNGLLGLHSGTDKFALSNRVTESMDRYFGKEAPRKDKAGYNFQLARELYAHAGISSELDDAIMARCNDTPPQWRITFERAEGDRRTLVLGMDVAANLLVLNDASNYVRGKIVGINPPNQPDLRMWFPSPATLARYGVRNTAGFWYPASHARLASLLKAHGFADMVFTQDE